MFKTFEHLPYILVIFSACSDPGILVWGSRSGPGLTARKQPGQQVFFFWGGGGGGGVQFSTYFTVYTLQRCPMVLLQRKLYFPKDPEGVQHFPVGPKC